MTRKQYNNLVKFLIERQPIYFNDSKYTVLEKTAALTDRTSNRIDFDFSIDNDDTELYSKLLRHIVANHIPSGKESIIKFWGNINYDTTTEKLNITYLYSSSNIDVKTLSTTKKFKLSQEVFIHSFDIKKHIISPILFTGKYSLRKYLKDSLIQRCKTTSSAYATSETYKIISNLIIDEILSDRFVEYLDKEYIHRFNVHIEVKSYKDITITMDAYSKQVIEYEELPSIKVPLQAYCSFT